jgi:drug/metabolite transporter (DMT)-like permease
VKDALELYPLFALLAVRFAIAGVVLAVPARGRVRPLGREGALAGVVLGVLLAAAYGFQTAGLERTTVSSTGFITGLYVVLTPLLALVLFRQSTAAVVWIGAGLAVIGFALLSGIDVGAPTGDLLLLASAFATALQILMVERYASRHDAVALTSWRSRPRASVFCSSRWCSASSRCHAAGRYGEPSSSLGSSRARSAT